MFCPNCGKEVLENAKFCPYCGYKLKYDSNEKKQKSEKKLLLKPVFIPWVTIASVIPLQIFFTIWGGIFFGGFSIPIANLLFHVNKVGATPFIFFGLLFFFGIPLLVYFTKKKTYEKTEYIFYNDHLEYYEGFWTLEKKSINYSHITEISLRKGVIQKKYGLGSIVLSTPATGYSRGRARSGIVIADIPKSDYVYKVLKNIIGK